MKDGLERIAMTVTVMVRRAGTLRMGINALSRLAVANRCRATSPVRDDMVVRPKKRSKIERVL